MSEVIAPRNQLDYIYVITILWKNRSHERVKYFCKLPSPSPPGKRPFEVTGGSGPCRAAGQGRRQPAAAGALCPAPGPWMRDHLLPSPPPPTAAECHPRLAHGRPWWDAALPPGPGKTPPSHSGKGAPAKGCAGLTPTLHKQAGGTRARQGTRPSPESAFPACPQR